MSINEVKLSSAGNGVAAKLEIQSGDVIECIKDRLIFINSKPGLGRVCWDEGGTYRVGMHTAGGALIAGLWAVAARSEVRRAREYRRRCQAS